MTWFSAEDERAYNNNEFDSMAAAILLINQNKQVLLNLRDDKPDILYPNFWSIIGGGIDPGETPVQTIVREVKEEVNYNIDDPVFLTKRVDTNQIVHFFVQKINATLDDFELNEGVDLNFFKKEELLDLKITPFIKSVLLDYFKNQ